MRNAGLLSPITIGSVQVRNRVYMPSMLTNFAAINGEVTERQIAYYEERAKGGAGIINVEGSAVDQGGKPFIRGISIADDAKIKGLSRLAQAIKVHGARASIQLIHGGRCVNPQISGNPVSLASYVPAYSPLAESVVMDIDDIQAVVRAFAAAALRARAAGFDMVELHGAHGYLLQQFASPLTNQRTDDYGGSTEKRLRFPLEVIRAVRRAVGPDFPIVYRHNAEDGLPGGLELEETLRMVNPFVDSGVDALHISCGMPESKHWISPPPRMPQAWKADVAAAVKQAIHSRVPVITVGRIINPLMAEEVITSGKADMVAVGRALIADPFLVVKYARGTAGEIVPCISCNEGCTGRTGKLLDITCAVNPRVGRELCRPREEKSAHTCNVAVVGGGAAGMAAALAAAERGHRVTLFEKNSELGGLLFEASIPPFKQDIAGLRQCLVAAVSAMGVDIRCNTIADVEMLHGFDAVIVATGSCPIFPPLFKKMRNAVTAADILLGTQTAGKRTLIVGGGLIGCETAEFLALKGCEVTVLERLPAVAADMEWRSRHMLIPELEKRGVTFMTGIEILETSEDGNLRVRDRFGVERDMAPFDTTVISVGYRADNTLLGKLEAAGIASQAAGDCVKPARILEAVYAGFEAGIML